MANVSTVPTAPTVSSVTAFLNKIVNNQVSGISWLVPETFPDVGTFREVINLWNQSFQQIRAQKQAHPSWFANGFPAYVANPGLGPDLGANWVPPQDLDADDYINAFVHSDLTKFNKFVDTLKKDVTALSQYIASSSADSNSIYYLADQPLSDKATWLTHMASLRAYSNTLWNRFNAKRLAAKAADSSGLPHLTDGVIIITDPAVIVSDATFANNQVFFVPQASDVNGKLQKLTTSRFNPPPHMSTKPLSPLLFPSGKMDYNITDLTPVQWKDSEIESYALSTEQLTDQINYANKLGFIYQDVQNVNTVATHSIPDLWGFQFMYNPSYIHYTVGSDPSLDWTAYGNPEGDISAVLFGQSSYDFNLVINRIVDMGVLKTMWKKNTLQYTSKGYPRVLTQEEAMGILTRGTEYDLEFLYRTCNGDPQLSPVMRNGQKTSDFGFLYGMPVWIRFHDNLRIKCIITSVDVKHVMFTTDMVPMYTEVAVSAVRVPVITYDSITESAIRSKLTQLNFANQKNQQPTTPAK